MFQVRVASAGGGGPGDGHDPGGSDNFVLMAARDVSQPAPDSIANDGITDPARSNETSASFSVWRGKKTDGDEIATRGGSLFAHLIKLRGQNQSFCAWER